MGRRRDAPCAGAGGVEVSAETRARVQALHTTLNRFPLARDIERQKKAIEARRRLPA
jgi:hypothetical protein